MDHSEHITSVSREIESVFESYEIEVDGKCNVFNLLHYVAYHPPKSLELQSSPKSPLGTLVVNSILKRTNALDSFTDRISKMCPEAEPQLIRSIDYASTHIKPERPRKAIIIVDGDEPVAYQKHQGNKTTYSLQPHPKFMLGCGSFNFADIPLDKIRSTANEQIGIIPISDIELTRDGRISLFAVAEHDKLGYEPSVNPSLFMDLQSYLDESVELCHLDLIDKVNQLYQDSTAGSSADQSGILNLQPVG